MLTCAALELANDYGLQDWIRALLDPSEIIQTNSSAKKPITAPPKFDLAVDKIKLPPPSATKTPRSRSTRSSSPTKAASPTKAKASPRKRQTKAQKEANIANANAASASLQSALDDAASVAGTTENESKPEPPAIDLAPVAEEDKVRVEVDQSVEVDGTTETTHTNVIVEMPVGLPELPLPEDTEKMLETAKKMVEEAKALDGAPKTKKRKAQDAEPSDIDAELPAQPAKKARVLEEKLKREKVRTRAVLGVTATLAIA